ncbi:MAG: CoA ester lyase [Actinobacteria bacterium]|nr:CoA ester lyase [Actinomycetota bacterium]MSX71410.1 CoA ester lyase [Actinomycetota bacterium]MSY69338.1 CoA ester lyase [Actinomycetota bacterium]MTA75341.1 CoA ester lyase [Actinomycetota bacterium]
MKKLKESFMTRINLLSKRSVLAVPGSSEKMIQKARLLNADEIFLDLEDSVSLPEKESARSLVISELNKGGFNSASVAVRVNEQNQSIGIQDIEELITKAPTKFSSIIIPKVETSQQVTEICQRLTDLELSQGLNDQTKIQLQIESARGLLNVKEIASACGRTISLIFGPGDFAASMGMQVLNIGENPVNYPGEDAYHHVLFSILTAARANGLLAIDGPFSDLGNEPGLKHRSQLSASLGYDGKWVIHPSQIEVVNSIFTPSEEVFEKSSKIIAHFNRSNATEKSAGAFLFEGKMIDEATRKMAEMIYSKGIAAGLKPSMNGDNNGKA